MILKDMINQVLSQSGFLKKSSFTNNPDTDDEQMIAIANRVNKEIMEFYRWTALRKQFTINVIDGQTQYQMPDDYLTVVPESVWQENGSRQVEIPVPDGRWYMYKFSDESGGGQIRARMYGKVMEISDPVDGDVIDLEYISNSPVIGDDTLPKELFTDDNDTWLLDDQVLILGIQAHWMQTKLMPQYQEHMGNYFRKLNNAIGREAASSTIGGIGKNLGRRDPYYPLYRS